MFIVVNLRPSADKVWLVDLFEPANRRILTLKPGKARLIANRHPGIFAGAITRESGPEDAAIADLLDPRGRRIASGFHSRDSQIRLRALTFGEEVLTSSTIVDRVTAAIRRRSADGDARATPPATARQILRSAQDEVE